MPRSYPRWLPQTSFAAAAACFKDICAVEHVTVARQPVISRTDDYAQRTASASAAALNRSAIEDAARVVQPCRQFCKTTAAVAARKARREPRTKLRQAPPVDKLNLLPMHDVTLHAIATQRTPQRHQMRRNTNVHDAHVAVSRNAVAAPSARTKRCVKWK